MIALTRPDGRNLLIAFAPAAFVFLWSTGFVGVKLGLPHAEPFTFLGLRFAATTVLVGGFMLIVGAPMLRSRVEFGHAMAVGALIHFTYITGVLEAERHGVSAGVVALVAGLQPLVTAALSRPLLRERVRLVQWLGLVLGFAGVALVVYAKLAVAETTLAGVAYAGMALTGVTGGTLYQKRFCTGMDLRASLVVQIATAGLICFGLAVTTEHFTVHWTGSFVFAVLWLAIVVSIGAFSLFLLMLRRGAAARVTSLFYLTPPTTAVLGWLLFDETLGPLALAGRVVAVAGVALANR
jgi:drug/metabolite transporter (DMT)-like permease